MEYIITLALPVPLDKTFDYLWESSEHIPVIGMRVLVPFGTKSKLYGVILDVKPKSLSDQSFEYKRAISLIDDEPYFTSEMIDFLKWLAEYYMTPLGEVFATAQPSIQPVEVKRKVKLKAGGKCKTGTKAEKIISLLSESASGELSVSTITRNIGSCSSVLNKLAADGVIELLDEIPTPAMPKTAKFVRINPELLEVPGFLEEEIDRIERKSPKRSLFLNMFRMGNSRNEFLKVSFASEHFGVSVAVINGLIDSEILEMQVLEDTIEKEEIKLATKREIDLPLTAEQQAVVEKFEQWKSKPVLLHGVTGSGKTLVYMHLIQSVLEAGQTALLLVPEISLTPQLTDRFELSFPGIISVVHSRMSKPERVRSLADIQSGKARIVIGARSAIFSPLRNLGLIIVDEEHDKSYKQDSPAPRYNGRDVAIVRAKFEHARVLLGSATPSLESMYNARNEKYELLEIKNRPAKANKQTATLEGYETAFGLTDSPLNTQNSALRAVDMLSAQKSGQIYKTLSKELLDEISLRIARHEGTILLQNRRGFASYLQCDDCGNVPGCPYCDVKLTYHKAKNQLKCHYCGYTVQAEHACTECGSVKLSVKGSGTQMVEEELEEFFNQAHTEQHCVKIERLDSDTTASKGAHRRILERFAKGETDILVGTQMVAKGLDFERVTLVGVINADQSLMMNDFRAGERTFQLLTQVAGRAGRKSENKHSPSSVLIQTTKTDDAIIRAVLAGDYEAVYQFQLAQRREANFPPFSRLVIIEFSSENQRLTVQHADTFRSLLVPASGIIIYPSTPPLIEKLREQYRRIIVIKDSKRADPSGAFVRGMIRHARNEYLKNFASRDVRISIDIDAYNNV